MKTIKLKDLNKQYKDLLEAAEKAMDTAYNPYTKFFVGAAVLSDDGEIITGSNVANASSCAGICAERAAVLRANAMGKRNIKAMAVIARSDNFNIKKVIAPCGYCRQVLYEFSQMSGNDIEVIMSNNEKDQIIIAKISELIPLPFGKDDIEVKL